MTKDLIDTAVALADALACENEALSQRDLSRAASMFSAKRLAVNAFIEVLAYEAPRSRRRVDRRLGVEVGMRLNVLVEENRRLLEHAIHVQGRVIGTIASAISRAGSSGYRPNGASAVGEAPVLTFSACA